MRWELTNDWKDVSLQQATLSVFITLNNNIGIVISLLDIFHNLVELVVP